MGGTETLKLVITAQDKASAVLKSSTKSVERSAASIKKAGTMMLAGGLALAAGLGYAVKQATMFQKDLAFVSTMLDESTMKYMPAYRKGLLDMSIQMGESSSTLAMGMYNILSSGIEASKGLEVLGVASKAAAAGMTTTETSAYAINAVLNAYVMTADRAGEVSDILFTIVKKGVLTFPQLAGSIGTLLGFAKSAKVPLEQLGAMIATVTKAGFSAEITMTALRGLFSMISRKAGPDATRIMEKYGIAEGSAALKGDELFKTLKAVNKMSEQEVSMLFSNIRARAALNALVAGQTNYYDALNAMENKEGATAEALAKIQETLWFQMKRLGAALKVILITGGETLIPIIKKLTTSFIVFLKIISNIPKPIKTMVMGFLSLAAILLIAGGAMLLITGSFKGLIAMKAGIIAVSHVLGGAAMPSLAIAFTRLKTAMIGFFWPLAKVIIALEGLYRISGLILVRAGQLALKIADLPKGIKIALLAIPGIGALVKMTMDMSEEEVKAFSNELIKIGSPRVMKGLFGLFQDMLKNKDVWAEALGIPAEKAGKMAKTVLEEIQKVIADTTNTIKEFTVEAINLPSALGLPSFLEVIEKMKEQSKNMASAMGFNLGSKLAFAPSAMMGGATSPGFRQLNVKLNIPENYQRLPDSLLAVVDRELGMFS